MKKIICIILFVVGAICITNAAVPVVEAVASPDELLQNPSEDNTEVPAETEVPPAESSESSTPPPSPCIGECPEVDPPYGAFLPHERCDKFCQCSHGSPVVIPCPGGLHFNPVLQICDWPQAANCTGIGAVEPPPNV